MNDVDVVVAGLGIHGSAAAYSLAERGYSVVGLEQFDPGHARGSSHGATRMIRRAYPNAVWNPLVERAFAGWGRWSAAAGRDFVHTTAGLYAHAEAGSLQGPGCEPVEPGGAATLVASLDLPAGFAAVYDPQAGVIEAEEALAFAQAEATRLGADLRFGQQMLTWREIDGGVEVTTPDGTIRAARLVVALGPWVAQSVPELAPFVEVWRILTVTAVTGQPDAAPPLLGSFSVDLPDGLVFGLPEVGGHGLKLGVDAGAVWNPAVPPAPPTADETEHLRGLLKRFVPGAEVAELDAVSCLYTMTPDKRFIVGTLPWAPAVLVVSACSGHGFKFGPAIGEAVADLVAEVPRADLDFLAVDRFVREPQAPRPEPTPENR